MRRSLVALAASVAVVLTLAGCSEEPAAQRPQQQQQQEKKEPAVPTGEFGSACSAVPKDGPGSFSGMAQDPVATAASNNPVLSTLVAAVTAAGLGDTLNSTEDLTVFAPTNDAFAKIPKADLDAVLADKAKLTSILTYHVVGKRITPADLASGSFETLQKGMVETSGSGESYKVNDANVVCGNVQTANATVYIIDTVLMPAS